MIKEAYCSLETSKLLKERGFNEKCRGCYHYEFDDNDSPVVMFEEWTAQSYNNDFVDEGFLCSAPTHQMAMAWLREIYDIYIVFFHTNKSGWWYNITDMRDSYVFYSSEKTMCSYEEVVDAALKYTLENLI